jgi:hypothetical protein
MMARTCFLVGVLHAASAATVGPHLFKDAEGPKVLRGLFPSEAAPEKIIEPFVGESYPLVRVHRDGDKKSGDDATAEALVSELKDKLPGDAFGTLARAAAPVSVVLQFEHLARDAWPEEIVDLAGPFGPTNPRADSEGGLLVHAYASSPGAAALAEHADTGDVLVVQLAGSKTFAFDGEAVTLAPGDGLVLPSGTRHAARAADDEASLHVTLHNFVPHEHLVTRSRRRLLEYADDDDEYADDDATSCWDYEGSDKECSCHCNECTGCSDADTVCASSVPEGYNREKYSVCCLSFGYRIEHDEDGNCDGYDELITPAPTPSDRGVAGRVSLEKIDDWYGSSGDGGSFTSSASDGSRIALTGTRNEYSPGYEESYLKVVGDDLDSLWGNSYDTEHLEDVLKEPYIYKFGTLCRNQALVADGEYGVQVEPSEWVLDGYLQVGYFRDSCDDEDLVVLYDDVAIRGGREACDVDLDEALGWDRVTSFALSEKSATAYVVGVHKDSDDRAVAAVKMEEDRCEVIWHANIATDEGTPRILAVNNDDRVEILLTSNEFFARVDRGTSSREGGDVKTLLIEKQLWLPGEGKAIVAYSDAEDVIFSAGYVDGKALLRASSADTGGELYEIDFTAELDAKNPYTSRSDYPPDCDYDDETLDCGGSTCDGYAGIDGCGSIDDEDDEGVCCQSAGTCCYMNFWGWAANWWNQKDTPVIEGIHVLGDKVAVVGAFKADLYDEDGSHLPFVALFAPTPSDAATPLPTILPTPPPSTTSTTTAAATPLPTILPTPHPSTTSTTTAAATPLPTILPTPPPPPEVDGAGGRTASSLLFVAIALAHYAL